MHFAVPSKNRAGKTTTQDILPSATFYVPESELHLYSQFTDNIETVPNSILGITKTRNWILKSTNHNRIVFVDDDVKYCGYNLMKNNKIKRIQIEKESFWLDEAEKLFDITEQLGYKIFGVKTESSPISQYEYYPIRFKSYVTASFMGIINDGTLYFDENYQVKEDYEICLRHIKMFGGILSAQYLHWENDHWETDGGCKDYRTVNMEIKCIKQLISSYPEYVNSITRKSSDFTIRLSF